MTCEVSFILFVFTLNFWHNFQHNILIWNNTAHLRYSTLFRSQLHSNNPKFFFPEHRIFYVHQIKLIRQLYNIIYNINIVIYNNCHIISFYSFLNRSVTVPCNFFQIRIKFTLESFVIYKLFHIGIVWIFCVKNSLQLLCYTVILDLMYRGIVLNTDLAEAAFSQHLQECEVWDSQLSTWLFFRLPSISSHTQCTGLSVHTRETLRRETNYFFPVDFISLLLVQFILSFNINYSVDGLVLLPIISQFTSVKFCFVLFSVHATKKNVSYVNKAH